MASDFLRAMASENLTRIFFKKFVKCAVSTVKNCEHFGLLRSVNVDKEYGYLRKSPGLTEPAYRVSFFMCYVRR